MKNKLKNAKLLGMMTEKLKKQINFLIEADKMKTVFRQTLLIDQSREENDAEHSWHIALMALTLFEYAADEDLDLCRVLKMALLHDLVEIYAGDTFAYDAVGNQTKGQKEREAADRIFPLLPAEQAKEYRALWEEFDAMATKESMYAAAIDRLQPFINNYKTKGHAWVKHQVTADQVYSRMAPVKEALPALWEFVEFVIQDSCEKGYIKEKGYVKNGGSSEKRKRKDCRCPESDG